MNINIDMAELLEQAKAMPDEVASLEELAPGLRPYYGEEDGRVRIDANRRKALVDHLAGLAENDRLATENKKLQDAHNRRLVVDAVRSQLTSRVKPELINAAVSTFISQHKFGIFEGKVIVVGKLGSAEAELALVRWMDNDENRSFLHLNTPEQMGRFSSDICKLKRR